MKVKSVEIANRLGISKATVSLAMNGKPGVSPETREAVLRCRDELEQQRERGISMPAAASVVQNGKTSQQLKIVMYDRKLSIICDSDLNLWPSVLRIFDAEARELGYSIGITYVTPEDVKEAVAACNAPEVAGVLLYATEMREEDFAPFRAVRKPLVVYDHVCSPRHHCVVADNEDGTMKLTRYLIRMGCKRIEYLAHKHYIYNFEQRRIGFIGSIHLMGLEREACPILYAGYGISDVESYMKEWLKEHPLPDAYIMENYQVSIGLMRALRELNIKVPEQVSLIGIDEVPDYMTDRLKMTCLHIDHTNRAQVVIRQLVQEIRDPSHIKLKIVSRSRLVEGDSVRKCNE